ncbi:MAG: adenylosuccinate lyase [Owenweeksia sp.]|nr:adenylosuccinate lyase [Owenweeksia sp.]MBF97498.1 adenylosuccinate lyase [Owenweeksia sp.]HCQ16352.1 adenylosuccinate lyase [Cryomorphaceae bacterium]|tara:strand:- start:2721 stop:4061 length:1341 start_codon:yes stop_codon:yes gene_type:complete
MENQLLAISPIDGRYRKVTENLKDYFSEYALIQYRVRVEVEYYIALCELPLPQLKGFDRSKYIELRDLYLDFSLKDAERIKEIEKTTNHDVKAVEYFIKEHLDDLGLGKFREFVHFGLTSQDINNTAVPLALKEFVENEYIPLIGEMIVTLTDLAETWADIPMLARTHGQPASPTRLGKEIMVFTERIDQQLRQLRHIPFSAKFGGATGNFNAHSVAYPGIDWKEFSEDFVNGNLGLQQSWPTTQIEHYDNMAALFDCLKRINTIIIDMNRDFWTYISLDYFKQRIKEGEVGSSAMPHKVNPIDFENSEGNLGIANALYEHLSAKLPISRLQRDLTDSTVLRNIGVPLGHSVIAINASLKGLSKLLINKDKISHDLEENWAVVAEGIQNILRREGYPNPYEALKGLTRTNSKINRESITAFIEGLDVDDSVKKELQLLSPQSYTGI